MNFTYVTYKLRTLFTRTYRLGLPPKGPLHFKLFSVWPSREIFLRIPIALLDAVTRIPWSLAGVGCLALPPPGECRQRPQLIGCEPPTEQIYQAETVTETVILGLIAGYNTLKLVQIISHCKEPLNLRGGPEQKSHAGLWAGVLQANVFNCICPGPENKMLNR